MGFKPKVKLNYCTSCRIVSRQRIETEEGVRFEDVNKLDSKYIDTPEYSNFSLEAQVASGQPLKRVNTCTMDCDIPSERAINELSNAVEAAKQAVADAKKE